MSVAEEMEQCLKEALAPTELEITNDSHLHSGHAGDDGSGETHFTVKIASQHFAGKTLIQQHQMVYGLLDAFLKGGVHALSLQTSIPKKEETK